MFFNLHQLSNNIEGNKHNLICLGKIKAGRYVGIVRRSYSIKLSLSKEGGIMSIRKVLLVFILILLSSCSSNVQIEDNPVEIYRAFEESLKGSDIQISMSYFHEDAVFTFDEYTHAGLIFEHTELDTSESIEALFQEVMDNPDEQDTIILDIYSVGNIVNLRLKFHSLDGWNWTQDGYAVIKEGKIFRLHYYPVDEYDSGE
jgi:hypothetical protein